MTTEGDRSGTHTPTHREKAKNLLDAAVLLAAKLHAEWDTQSATALDDRLAQIEDNIFKAGLHVARIET